MRKSLSSQIALDTAQFSPQQQVCPILGPLVLKFVRFKTLHSTWWRPHTYTNRNWCGCPRGIYSPNNNITATSTNISLS